MLLVKWPIKAPEVTPVWAIFTQKHAKRTYYSGLRFGRASSANKLEEL